MMIIIIPHPWKANVQICVDTISNYTPEKVQILHDSFSKKKVQISVQI